MLQVEVTVLPVNKLETRYPSSDAPFQLDVPFQLDASRLVAAHLARQDDEEGISDERRHELVDPLDSQGELEEEGTEEEGEQVLHFAVWEHRHYKAKGVAQEEAKSVRERVIVEAYGVS